MNLTDLRATPLHIAYQAAKEEALRQGTTVTGSELIGLVPLSVMLDAGRYFLGNRAASETELIQEAVKSLGLDQFAPFDPDLRILEYAIRRV